MNTFSPFCSKQYIRRIATLAALGGVAMTMAGCGSSYRQASFPQRPLHSLSSAEVEAYALQTNLQKGGVRQYTDSLSAKADELTIPQAFGEGTVHQRQEVKLFALGLLGTRYRYGGKTPERGLDCSGMVSYVYKNAIRRPINGNAASMARQGKQISLDDVKVGDLLFFNTRGRPRSHVGIYIGGRRFVHALNRRAKVRIDRLDNRYYAKRFEEARTYLE